MTDVPSMPPHIIRLGIALSALRARHLNKCQLPSNAASSGLLVDDMDDWRSEQFLRLKHFAEQLPIALAQLTRDVVDSPDVIEPERTAGFAVLEHVLATLNRDYERAAVAVPTNGNVAGRDAFLACYSELHQQVMSWLDDVCATIANPAPTLQARGLPSSGVTLDMTLILQPPKALVDVVAAFAIAA